ncbi:MAG: hypothetical protein ACRBBW_20330 [Cellvibrionaceae bacterium]
MNRGTLGNKNVTGEQSESPSKHATYHTIACEGVGTVTVTARPFGLDTAQAVDNGEIDLSAPTPVTIAGHLFEIVLTPASGGDVYSYSVTSSD